MAAFDPQWRIDLADQLGDAAAHVAPIGLYEEGPHRPGRGDAGVVIKDPPVARMGRIPGRIAAALRQRIGLVVDGDKAVAVDRP